MESPVNPQESSRIPKNSLPTFLETSYKNFEVSSHSILLTSEKLPLFLVGKTAIEKTVHTHSGH